jgi:hypothetical protein
MPVKKGPAKKPSAALIEKYGSMTERYKSVAAKRKHEATEPASQLRKESKAEAAFAKKKTANRTLAKRGM